MFFRPVLFMTILLGIVAFCTDGATPPGGGQTSDSGKNNNTPILVAVGTVGLAIVGGLLWWRFHQPSGAERDVFIRKPKGEVPRLAVTEFSEESPGLGKEAVSRKVRNLLVACLKKSQAFVISEKSSLDSPTEGLLILTAKVGSLTQFSQAEVSVTRDGKPVFLQTITWFEDRELEKQIAGLTNALTESLP